MRLSFWKKSRQIRTATKSSVHALPSTWLIEARDRRILEFPFSTSSETVAEILKAGALYDPLNLLSNFVSCWRNAHAFLARSSRIFSQAELLRRVLMGTLRLGPLWL